MHSILYPYKVSGFQRLPIVPITLFGRRESTKTEAYVDPGLSTASSGFGLQRRSAWTRHLAGDRSSKWAMGIPLWDTSSGCPSRSAITSFAPMWPFRTV